MGIIDDYYGGYESLGLFMDEDGIVDYEAAYGAYCQCKAVLLLLPAAE
jgi:hypothetical protein